MSDPVYMVCGGPSLRGFDFDRLRGKRHVALNRAYETCPEAFAVVFDWRVWREHREGLLAHRGEIVCWAPPAEGHERLTVFQTDALLSSTACLLWLAERPDVERVILLGCDHKLGPGGERYWHSGYPRTPTDEEGYASMTKHLCAVGKACRLEIVNANPDSAVRCFPMVSLEEALGDAVSV